MTRSQHIWLRPGATAYSAECEECLYGRGPPRSRHVEVSGTLRADADVGFTTCMRGHRIVVRRVSRAFAPAAR
jgi:hypothetical protein